MRISFKWLSPASIKKNFDWKEFVALVLPTTYAYYDGLDKLYKKIAKTECPDKIAISTSIIVFILLILFDILRNYKKKIKAISEALETGYFNNFFITTFTVIMDKLRAGQPLTFNFKNTSKPPVVTNNVKVIIILPKSQEELIKQVDLIRKKTDEATINGSWVNIEIQNKNVIIHECPRTLATIRQYLAIGQGGYTQEDLIKYHKYFIDKFLIDYDPTKFNFEIKIV